MVIAVMQFSGKGLTLPPGKQDLMVADVTLLSAPELRMSSSAPPAANAAKLVPVSTAPQTTTTTNEDTKHMSSSCHIHRGIITAKSASTMRDKQLRQRRHERQHQQLTKKGVAVSAAVVVTTRMRQNEVVLAASMRPISRRLGVGETATILIENILKHNSSTSVYPQRPATTNNSTSSLVA